MIPIVTGTRTRAVPVGVVAIDCVACGRRAVAEVYRVESTNTLYTVQLGRDWENHGYFALCRCCRQPQGVSRDLDTVPDPGRDVDDPTPELIAACGARLPATPPEPPPLRTPLPSGVTRADWALLVGLAHARKQALGQASLSVGVAVIALMAFCVTALVQVGQWYGDHTPPSTTAVAACLLLMAVVAAACWMRFLELRQGLREEFATPLRRHFARTNTKPRHFLLACDLLGRQCFLLRPFITWVEDPQPPPSRL